MLELVFGHYTAVIVVLLSQFINKISNSSEGVVLTLSGAVVGCPCAAVGQLTPDPGMRIGVIVGGIVIR